MSNGNCIGGLLRKLTQAEIDNLTPVKGQIILNTTTTLFQSWNGITWVIYGEDHVWGEEQW